MSRRSGMLPDVQLLPACSRASGADACGVGRAACDLEELAVCCGASAAEPSRRVALRFWRIGRRETRIPRHVMQSQPVGPITACGCAELVSAVLACRFVIKDAVLITEIGIEIKLAPIGEPCVFLILTLLRAAYSHSASLGRRYFLPVFPDSHSAKASESFHETHTIGYRSSCAKPTFLQLTLPFFLPVQSKSSRRSGRAGRPERA